MWLFSLNYELGIKDSRVSPNSSQLRDDRTQMSSKGHVSRVKCIGLNMLNKLHPKKPALGRMSSMFLMTFHLTFHQTKKTEICGNRKKKEYHD